MNTSVVRFEKVEGAIRKNLLIHYTYFGSQFSEPEDEAEDILGPPTDRQPTLFRRVSQVDYKLTESRNQLHHKVLRIQHDPIGTCERISNHCAHRFCICEGRRHPSMPVEALCNAALHRMIAMQNRSVTFTSVFHILRYFLAPLDTIRIHDQQSDLIFSPKKQDFRNDP
jgi:hypothetical protein